MRLIIYGDFNCPCCYLASQRADRLLRAGAEICWRAVEHNRSLPVTGLPVAGRQATAGQAEWDRKLAEVRAQALAGEQAPAGLPPILSNTGALTAAYAESVADGIQDELRRTIFSLIWTEGRNLSSVHEVRHLVTSIMWQPSPITARLASPDLPDALDRDPDLARITRRSGGTIAPDGGPLTTEGYQRIRQWRRQWLAMPQQAVPAVIGPDSAWHSGGAALRYLARLLPDGGAASPLAATG